MTRWLERGVVTPAAFILAGLARSIDVEVRAATAGDGSAAQH
jgi:hypothetical protein